MKDPNSGLNPTQPEEKKEYIEVPYSDDEKAYASYLQTRLQDARDSNNQNYELLDGMTRLQYYESNSKGANSFIAPKKNKEDTTFVTGTTRQALLAMEAKINMLNLSPEIKAFDKNNHETVKVGQGMEIIIAKADELDHDEEKKYLRQYEMYTQGTVFVEEIWTEKFKTNKDLNTKKWDGQVKNVEWKERLEKVYEGCCRNLLPMPNVFLGSMNEFHMEDQPYVFTIDYITYEEAKSIYGGWERWKYVTRDLQNFAQPMESSIAFNNWRLQTTQKNMVEIIRYQDKPLNEYMIILNGVMMMPIGFPMPWNYGEYNIVKQIYELLSPYFPLGGSLVKRLKGGQAIENEFWRLTLLKTQISFKPPRGNMTGKVLSNRVFNPGVTTMGLNPDLVKPLIESQGVNNSEVEVLRMLKENLNDNSLPDIAKGQQPQGDPTATQIMQQQREAQTLLNNAVFSAQMLEKKLSVLRLYNLLENWFEPTGTEADMMRKEIKDKYRSASINASIQGAGKGRKMVKLAEQMPAQEPFPGKDEVYNEEEDLSKAEGQPVRITYLNPKEIKSAKLTWYIEVNAREKESSELSKVLFGTMLQSLQQIGQTAQLTPSANLDFIQERFAEVWNLPADKAFSKQAQQTLGGMPMGMPQGGMPGQGQIPAQMQQAVTAGVQQQRPSINTLVGK